MAMERRNASDERRKAEDEVRRQYRHGLIEAFIAWDAAGRPGSKR